MNASDGLPAPKYLLDTNICIYAMNGNVGVLKKFRDAGREAMAVSSLAMSEMAFGVAKSQRIAENTAALKRFHAGLRVLPWDDSAMWIYGEHFFRLQKAGRKIGEVDLLLACQALALNATMVTNNTREFERIEGLKLENWVA